MPEKPEFSVLIVDDEKSNLDVLNHILKQKYRVYVAKSGQAALKIVSSFSPDLVLLDIIMPNMNGYEVLTELKRNGVTRAIPVIFITGLDSIEDEEKGFALGAVDYITKPFHNSIVLARVKTQLQIVKQMRTIERIGMIDALTDIPNRRSFDERLAAEWKRSMRDKTSLSLLMLDVDEFKLYNDTYGHVNGDTVLQKIARILCAALRRPGDIAARWGGEEFAVLLPDTGSEGAFEVAESIRVNIQAKFADAPLPTTVSLGVASAIPTPDDDMDDFLAKADKALYAAKAMGRNVVCC